MSGRSIRSLPSVGALLFLLASQTLAQSDPLALRQQAIRRIDGFVEAFRKTGDMRSHIPDLAHAERELAASNQVLAARGSHDPKSDAERRMLAQVRGQERTYGDAAVDVKTEAKRGLSRTIEWTDVYFPRGSSSPQNVSACDGVNRGQPSLSPDGRRVAFVKAGG